MSLIAKPRHLRMAKPSKICNNGARQWFAQRGWSWADFVQNGRAIEDFEATGCPLAARLVAAVREEAENDGR